MNGSNGTPHDAPAQTEGPTEHPFVVKKDGVFGQFLETTRDLPAGSLVLEEPYAFWGPSADYVEDYTTPICCGCAVVMNDGNEDFRCDKCGWPLCGPSCDKVDYHESFECSLFSKEKVPFPPNLPIQHAYKGLTIVRGLLLKQTSPDLFSKVLNLQHINEIQDSPPPDFTEFRTEFGLPEFSTPSEWSRILGTLNVNSYSIQRIEKKAGSPSFAEFIYPFQCLMNHSCIPNCNWAIAYSPSFAIQATAAVDIPKGSMLTVAYNFDLSKYGAHKRHQKIRDQAKFSCKCERCQDPTDFGTFAAAVLCFKCKSGYLLPQDSLDPNSPWKCSECPYKTDASFLSSFVDSLHEQVEMTPVEAAETDESPVELLEEFISEKSGSVLHPNHWVLTAASQSIVHHLVSSQSLDSLSLEQLDTLISHCERLLTIRNVVTRGICTEKGILQHHMARAKFARTQLAVASEILAEPGEIETEMRKVYEIQKSALLFWRQNPHYGSLHANYKGDAELLAQEMQRVKSNWIPQSEVPPTTPSSIHLPPTLQ